MGSYADRSDQALQAAVQRIHTYMTTIEEKLDSIENRKS